MKESQTGKNRKICRNRTRLRIFPRKSQVFSRKSPYFLFWSTTKQRKKRRTGRMKVVVSSILLLLSLLVRHSLSQELGKSATTRTLGEEEGHAHEVHCSRERSRAAWQIIEDYLMPFVERERYQIPKTCRLHPDNDLFRDQERHKIHHDVNEWKCGYCKKSFHAENFLDQHFDNRHYNLLNTTHSKCLADLCGALHCDFVLNSKKRKSKCNPAAVAKHRHLCERLANNCFPVNHGPSGSRLHELFLRQFCDAHTCTGRSKPFPKGGKKGSGVFYLAISILTLMFLPIFYLLVFLYQREMRSGTQELRRITKIGRKTKPS